MNEIHISRGEDALKKWLYDDNLSDMKTGLLRLHVKGVQKRYVNEGDTTKEVRKAVMKKVERMMKVQMEWEVKWRREKLMLNGFVKGVWVAESKEKYLCICW